MKNELGFLIVTIDDGYTDLEVSVRHVNTRIYNPDTNEEVKVKTSTLERLKNTGFEEEEAIETVVSLKDQAEVDEELFIEVLEILAKDFSPDLIMNSLTRLPYGGIKDFFESPNPWRAFIELL